MSYGLALEGGGARGAYEVGAYYALRELGYDFSAIVGTSIGAINGALFAQGDEAIAKRIWEECDLYFDFTRLIQEKKNNRSSDKLFDIGFSLKPLQDIIEKYVDEEKIRKSPIKFGLTTLNITDFRAERLFVDEIPNGKLKNYIIASSYLPIFKRIPLDGKYYLDGGFISNIPVEMLDELNLKPISIRLRKNFFIRGEIIISPKKSLGSTINFDKNRSKELYKRGYFDTYKEIKSLIGQDYYIVRENREKYIRTIKYIIRNKFNHFNNYHFIDRDENLFKFNDKNYEKILVALLERYAKRLNVERYKIYTIDELMGKIL